MKPTATLDAALQHSAGPEDRMVGLASGPMRVRRHGAATAPLAIGVPGLSANCFTFEAIGESLAGKGRALAAVDLRGRGRSPAGARGTHGWESHARDVLAVADALGASRFDFIGHSMGAFIGLVVANLAPERVRRLVLIDAVGVPDSRAMPPIFAAVNRLNTVHPSADAFIAKVKAAGIVPWSRFWEAHYREDLVEVPGGVQQRANQTAVLEDLGYAAVTQVRELWPGVGASTLLVRAAQSLGLGGDVITADDRQAFLKTAPRAKAVEIDANHYGVINHPDTARAVEEFLR